jgi:hypothetical protein
MSSELQRHIEPLEAEELLFLEEKAAKDRSIYFKVFRVMMIFSFILPFIGAWYRALGGAENAFSPTRFFAGVIALVALSSGAVYMSYRRYAYKVELDIRDKTKIIEKSHIMKKVEVRSNGTYHFYIDSAIKLSIEVSQGDFMLMHVGDEVSIEYTAHSMEYLGYF